MDPTSPSSRRPVVGSVTTIGPGTGTTPRPAIEPASVRQTISLRATFAGILISFLVYAALLSLGMAVGASSLQGIIQKGQNAGGLGLGTGIWMIVSTFISLFLGGYFSGRVSGIVPSRLGGVQGLVISALFFGIVLSSIGSAVSLIGQGVGSTVGAAGSAVGDLSQNPQVQTTVQNAIGGLNLKSPPDQIVQGLSSRLIRGDTTGARDYLANQAGISPSEAQARIDTLTTNFNNTLKSVGSSAAHAASVAGWTLFLSIVIGSLAAVWGGTSGVRRNLLRPLSDRDIDLRQRSSVA